MVSEGAELPPPSRLEVAEVGALLCFMSRSDHSVGPLSSSANGKER